MAVDAAILEAVAEGAQPPTLRFYAWAPPCLSLGRNQPLADVDQGACRKAGVDLVRRPTGGRAILHTDELTYSLVLDQSDARATGDVVESYRRLSEGMLAGLRRLGVEVTLAGGHRQEPTELSAACFEVPSNHEITTKRCKLVGSAQWRTRGAVLQHGTLPLQGDISRVVEFLNLSQEERATQRKALLSRATTLERATGQTLDFAEVARNLAIGFAEILCLELAPHVLGPQERVRAEEFRRSQYADRHWTERS